MRGEDVLADQVQGVRPLRLKARLILQISLRGDVIEQRIEPDVRHVLRIERQRDSPVQTRDRARYTQVAQRFAQEAQHLIAPVLGLNKARVILDIRNQPILILAHTEEVVVLGDPLHRAATVGTQAAFLQVFLRPEALVGHAVPARVFAAVNLPIVPQPLEHRLHHPRVARLGGADKIVVGDRQLFPRALESRCHLVHVVLRIVDAMLFYRILHLLTVLIHSGQKEDRLAAQVVVARQHIRQDGAVGVPQVRLVIHIIDRRRNRKHTILSIRLNKNSPLRGGRLNKSTGGAPVPNPTPTPSCRLPSRRRRRA